MFSKALPIFSLIPVAFAGVYVTAPVETTTYSGGKAGAVVSWMDDKLAPSLTDIGVASISIFVGNAKQQTRLQTLNPGVDVSTTTSIDFTPDASIGPNGQEYFIRFQSLKGLDNASQPLEAFSHKFTLDNMTGTFNASISSEIAGQSTAPIGPTSSGSSSPTSSPLTASSTSKSPSSASTTASATAKPSSGAMGLKAGWAGIVFGAVVGVTMF